MSQIDLYSRKYCIYEVVQMHYFVKHSDIWSQEFRLSQKILNYEPGIVHLMGRTWATLFK